MAETLTVARPYARAVFAEAQASGTLATWSDLLEAAAVVSADPALQAVLAHPKISAADKVAVFCDICDAIHAGGFPPQGRNLIRLLAEQQRLALLPDIAALFTLLRAEAERTVHAEVLTAFALTDDQVTQLANALRARLQRDVTLSWQVDESLLGGVLIRIGDWVIDGSARGQLDRLAAALH